MSTTYNGGCQCGKVRYEVSMDLREVTACNCSRCGKLGTLLAFAPEQNFKLLSGEADMSEYLFNKHIIHHLFCSTCGVESFARGKSRDGADMIAVNARCLDDVDVATLKVNTFDGRSR